MKLASLKDGTRDGRLVVVSRDLSSCIGVAQIAPTLQSALDRWEQVEAPLRMVADRLDGGGYADDAEAEVEDFHPIACR